MAIKIVPYRQASKSAKALAKALGGRVLLLEGSNYIPVPTDTIINWGNTTTSLPGLLNPPLVIKRASNKKTFFEMMKTAGLKELLPRFWTDPREIPSEAYPIVCRTVLSGHSGEGIVIANKPSECVSATLYTQYMKKSDEYRIHLGAVNGEVFLVSIQQKRRRLDHPDPDWKVRNHDNGFIYARGDVNPPTNVVSYASQVFAASGLDFGAVDVIYSNKTGAAYVLEINTAPGLEGTTITDYKAFFGSECFQ